MEQFLLDASILVAAAFVVYAVTLVRNWVLSVTHRNFTASVLNVTRARAVARDAGFEQDFMNSGASE